MLKREGIPNALETLANVVTTFGAICRDNDTPPKLNRLFADFIAELYTQASILRGECDIIPAKRKKSSHAMATT